MNILKQKSIHIAALLLLVSTIVITGCANQKPYVPHPGSINVFDSRTADLLSDEHAFLIEAEKHVGDYNQVVTDALTVAQRQYEVAKSAYLTWRSTQAPNDQDTLNTQINNLVEAITSFTSKRAQQNQNGGK